LPSSDGISGSNQYAEQYAEQGGGGGTSYEEDAEQ